VYSRESAGARWILVADGDEAAANRVAGFLLSARLRAYPVARGLEGLRLARRHRLGLAVVDVNLLDMTGRDLVRQLRAIEPALPVVMTTADYRPTTEVEARQLGIVQYIHKPVDLHRLDLVIARIMAADTELAPRVAVPSNVREGAG
jgi:two-component system response regulator HydG